MKLFFVFFFSLFFAHQSYSQAPRFNPSGVTGYAGAGFATFTIKEPQALDFKMDQGVYAFVGGEKGFNFLNFYLTFSFGYLSTKGQTNYSYSTLSGQNYTTTDVNFNSQLFQAGLGLKYKLIDGYFFRPYIEGGGLFGYNQLRYSFNSTQRTELETQGSNYKSEDSIFDLGYYGEAGLEVDFSGSFGLKAAARFTKNETKEYETLNKQKLQYESIIYHLALLKRF